MDILAKDWKAIEPPLESTIKLLWDTDDRTRQLFVKLPQLGTSGRIERFVFLSGILQAIRPDVFGPDRRRVKIRTENGTEKTMYKAPREDFFRQIREPVYTDTR
jgi:hypothetical protein